MEGESPGVMAFLGKEFLIRNLMISAVFIDVWVAFSYVFGCSGN
jgi:hypothetical protein